MIIVALVGGQSGEFKARGEILFSMQAMGIC